MIDTMAIKEVAKANMIYVPYLDVSNLVHIVNDIYTTITIILNPL